MRTEREASPFLQAPDPEVFFHGAGREEICQALILDILNDKRLLRLGGAAGSGKSLLCRVIMTRLPATVTPVYLDDPAGSFDDLLRHAALNLGAARSGRADDFSWPEEFNRQLLLRQGGGNRVLLLIDQAEQIFAAALERLLHRNSLSGAEMPAFGLLLSGGEELDALLDQLALLGPKNVPESSYTLAPLDQDETEKYLRYRLHAAGFDWDTHDAILGKKRVSRIFRQARGNIALTNRAAGEMLADRLPKRGAAEAEHRPPPDMTPGEARSAEAPEAAAGPAAPAAPAKDVGLFQAISPHREANEEGLASPEGFASPRPAPESDIPPPSAAPAPPREERDEPTEEPEEEDGIDAAAHLDEREDLPAWGAEALDSLLERFARWRDAGKAGLVRLEKSAAPKVIGLYELLVGDKRILGGTLGAAFFFCILGLWLGAGNPPETPLPPAADQAQTDESGKTGTPGEKTAATVPNQAPAAPAPRPQTKQQPGGAALLRERLNAGAALVAASYRGASTIHVRTLTGATAEKELVALLDEPPFRRVAEQLYVVRKPTVPPAYFVFYGIFDSQEQARQARNNMNFELRAHHPFPLPVSDALRLNE